MTSLLLLSSLALATSPSLSTGVAWPGAAPMAAGEGAAGAYVMPIAEADGPAAVVGARAFYAPTDRLGVQLDVGAMGTLETQSPASAIGARYLVVDSPWFRAAATASVGGIVLSGTPFAAGMAGVAVEAGSDVVWFDASSPLVAVIGGRDDTEVYGLTPALATELGVNVRIAGHHSLRAGMASILPVLSYGYEADRWFARGDLSVLPYVSLPVVRVAGGVRF